jgi:DNA-binding NtrC family response regulator
MATRFHNKGLDGMASSTVSFAVVVDDDLFILMHACDILGAAGFRFHEAGTEEEAKTLLTDHADDVTLLFSDLEMPGDTDGFALAHYVAEHRPWIEIVIASGNVKPGPGDMPDKATFIGKPFNDRMVHQHLREKLPDNKQPEQLKQAV